MSYDEMIVAIEKLNEAIRKMSMAIEREIIPIAHGLSENIRTFIIRTCPNKYWVHMAFHSKKYRIRKKYINMIFNHYYEVVSKYEQ